MYFIMNKITDSLGQPYIDNYIIFRVKLLDEMTNTIHLSKYKDLVSKGGKDDKDYMLTFGDGEQDVESRPVDWKSAMGMDLLRYIGQKGWGQNNQLVGFFRIFYLYQK